MTGMRTRLLQRGGARGQPPHGGGPLLEACDGKGKRPRPCLGLTRPQWLLLLAICTFFWGMLQLTGGLTFSKTLPGAHRGPNGDGFRPAGAESAPVTRRTGADKLAEAGPAAGKLLLLASHNMLQFYDVERRRPARVLHEGRGVYYGTFPGDPWDGVPTLWVISRPHNWRSKGPDDREVLLRLGAGDPIWGQVLEEKAVEASFLHDGIRAAESGDVFLADTEGGNLLQLEYPGMALKTRHAVFTRHDHVNTVAMVPGSKGREVLAVLHGMGGQSEIARVDVALGQVVQKYSGFGTKCHGLVNVGPDQWLMLDSGSGSLILVSLNGKGSIRDRAVGPKVSKEVLWQDSERTFLKGLTVVGDVAFFGISKWGSRKERDSPDKTADLAAFDLVTRQLVFRETVETHGLLNVVAAPHLAVGSTYTANPSWQVSTTFGAAPAFVAAIAAGPGAAGAPTPVPAPNALEMPAPRVDEQRLDLRDPRYAEARARARARVDGERMELDPDLPAWNPEDGEAPINLQLGPGAKQWMPLAMKDGARHNEGAPLMLQLGDLDPALLAPIQAFAESADLWDPVLVAKKNVRLMGRDSNQNRFKPGTQTVHLIFSDHESADFYRYPYWHRYSPELKPAMGSILEPILGPGWENHLSRVQFARMPPGTNILKHVDSGPWAARNHRVHFVVQTNPEVDFFVFRRDAAKVQQETPIPVHEGSVFELNNRLPHRVQNTGVRNRIHLLVDYSEEAHEFHELKAGDSCDYKSSGRSHKGIVCASGSLGEE